MKKFFKISSKKTPQKPIPRPTQSYASPSSFAVASNLTTPVKNGVLSEKVARTSLPTHGRPATFTPQVVESLSAPLVTDLPVPTPPSSAENHPVYEPITSPVPPFVPLADVFEKKSSGSSISEDFVDSVFASLRKLQSPLNVSSRTAKPNALHVQLLELPSFLDSPETFFPLDVDLFIFDSPKGSPKLAPTHSPFEIHAIELPATALDPDAPVPLDAVTTPSSISSRPFLAPISQPSFIPSSHFVVPLAAPQVPTKDPKQHTPSSALISSPPAPRIFSKPPLPDYLSMSSTPPPPPSQPVAGVHSKGVPRLSDPAILNPGSSVSVPGRRLTDSIVNADGNAQLPSDAESYDEDENMDLAFFMKKKQQSKVQGPSSPTGDLPLSDLLPIARANKNRGIKEQVLKNEVQVPTYRKSSK